MERQTKITKEIKELKNKQALLYATIKMNSNYYNGESEIAIKKLMKLTSIPESTIKKNRLALLDSGIFSKWEYFTDRWGHTRIRYLMDINPENYILLKNDYLKDAKLTPNETGFLLKLKCLTLNNTNLIGMNVTNIRKKLKVGKNNTIIDSLINKGYVYKFDSTHFYILNSNILFTSNEDIEAIYRVIESFCINKKIIPPSFDKKKLNSILLKCKPDKLEKFLPQKCSAFEEGHLYDYIFSILYKRPPVNKNTHENLRLKL